MKAISIDQWQSVYSLDILHCHRSIEMACLSIRSCKKNLLGPRLRAVLHLCCRGPRRDRKTLDTAKVPVAVAAQILLRPISFCALSRFTPADPSRATASLHELHRHIAMWAKLLTPATLVEAVGLEPRPTNTDRNLSHRTTGPRSVLKPTHK